MKLTLAASIFCAASLFFSSPAALADATKSSWYGDECAGKLMANRKPFRPAAMTCASWDYSLGTKLRVVHGKRAVVVTVTDRGPAKRLYARGRRLDLSRGAFQRLAPLKEGVIKVDIFLERGDK